MVGVQAMEECPKCGNEGNYEFQTRDFSEWFSCRTCGYGISTERVYGADGLAVEDKDGKWIYHANEAGGAGCYFLTTTERRGGSFGAVPIYPPDLKDFLDDTIRMVEKDKDLIAELSLKVGKRFRKFTFKNGKVPASLYKLQVMKTEGTSVRQAKNAKRHFKYVWKRRYAKVANPIKKVINPIRNVIGMQELRVW